MNKKYGKRITVKLNIKTEFIGNKEYYKILEKIIRIVRFLKREETTLL